MQLNHAFDQNIFTNLTLPPGLPLPHIPNISALAVSFDNPFYLERNSDELKEISLQWWGTNKPHSLWRQDKEFKGQYPISCSLEQFFGYLKDMKLLGVKIIGRRGLMGKAFLNFLLIRGWRGEHLEGILDIKAENRKIGQIAYSIQIVNISNPHIAEKPELSQRQAQNNLQHPQIAAVRKFPKFIQVTEERPSQIQDPQIKQQKSTRKTSDQNIFALGPLLNKNKNTNFIVQDHINNEVIKQKGRSWNYDAEIVRLTEDYNVLFNKTSPSSHFSFEGRNIIEIQVAQIQIEQKKVAQIELTVPLIGGNNNFYRVFPGAIIKIHLPKENNQQQLINYLQECQIILKYEGKLQGSIRLTKLLASAGDYQRVPLYDNLKSKQKKRQKGVCLLRAVPIQQEQPKAILQKDKKLVENQQNTIEPNKQKQQIQKGQYILFNLKNYHSIDFASRTFNIFVRIICKQIEICQSQTLWNTTLPCTFDQRLTGKIIANKLEIEVYERKQQVSCFGSGQLQLNSPLGIALQIPIMSRYKKAKTVGYISLDYFKNGLQGVTKMSQVLLKNKPVKSIPVQVELQKQAEVIEETPFQQTKNHEIQQSLENQDLKQIIKEQQHTIPKNIQSARKRSILEVYNSIFTYFYSHPQIPERLLQKESLKISEFLVQIQGTINGGAVNASELNQVLPNHIVSKGEEEKVYLIDCNSLIECYQAFLTYFEEIAAQKDEILNHFLRILEQSNLSINDLEYELGGEKKIWKKINSILQYRKGSNINIVEKLKNYYIEGSGNRQVYGRQLCDSLRKFEVFQTTIGQKIDHKLLAERVYSNTVMILQELQIDINFHSHRQLIECLQNQQIILSFWELQNLEMYLHGLSLKSVNNFRDNQKIKHESAINEKQTITKSPTFGYLHQAEQTKRTATLQPEMRDSLAIKMQELAISPINYVSNNSHQPRQAKVFFTNLIHKPTQLIVDGVFLKLQIFDKAQTPLQQKSNFSKQFERKAQESNQNQQGHNKKSSELSQNEIEQWVCEVKQGVELKFSYQIQIELQGLGIILLECLHGQWSAIIDEQGEYLGGILIQ